MRIARSTSKRLSRPTWSRDYLSAQGSVSPAVVRETLNLLAEDPDLSVLQLDIDPPTVNSPGRAFKLHEVGPGPADLLATVAELMKQGRRRKALARIYDAVDGWLFGPAEDRCDEFLDRVVVDHLDPTILVGILTITLTGRERLSRRADFVARVRQHLERAETGRVDELLAGLE